MNESFIQSGKNITMTIIEKKMHRMQNFLFTSLHICSVGVRCIEPFTHTFLEES